MSPWPQPTSAISRAAGTRLPARRLNTAKRRLIQKWSRVATVNQSSPMLTSAGADKYWMVRNRVILWRFYFEGSRAVSKAELQRWNPTRNLSKRFRCSKRKPFSPVYTQQRRCVSKMATSRRKRKEETGPSPTRASRVWAQDDNEGQRHCHAGRRNRRLQKPAP